jgi:hypothetical protein
MRGARHRTGGRCMMTPWGQNLPLYRNITPGEIGEPMFNLDAGEQRIYNRIREHLHLHKAGKQVDEIYLSIAARAIGHLLHNAEILSKDGAVMVHPNGARQVSAEWTAFKQGFELFLELS